MTIAVDLGRKARKQTKQKSLVLHHKMCRIFQPLKGSCTLPYKRCLSHDMCLYQVMMMLHFLNDVANDAESTQKIENSVIIASLKSETIGKLINRIPGSHLLISSLPGTALRTHVELLGKPRNVSKHSQSLAW